MKRAGNVSVACSKNPPSTVCSTVAAKPLSPDQFVVLLARHERRVRGFIASLLTCRSDLVEDILQSTFLVAWRKLDTFSYGDETPDEELVRWMCTIARFETLNANRKGPTGQYSVDTAAIEAIAESHFDYMDGLEDRFEALKVCLERLPIHHRELLSLRYWQGLSVDEVASRLGRHLNAVYTSLSRVRKTLEQCITHSLRQKGQLL